MKRLRHRAEWRRNWRDTAEWTDRPGRRMDGAERPATQVEPAPIDDHVLRRMLIAQGLIRPKDGAA